MNALDKLLISLKDDIKRFDGESQKHKRLHRCCQTAIIALSAVTTIVAGAGLVMPAAYGNVLQFTVLCIATISTAVSGWSEMRRARDLWQHEREVCYALIDIEREIEFKAVERELTDEDLEKYFRRISTVLSSSTQKWARIQERKDDKANEGGPLPLPVGADK